MNLRSSMNPDRALIKFFILSNHMLFAVACNDQLISLKRK